MKRIEYGFIPPSEKIIKYANQISKHYSLDCLTSEELTKFAMINFRIKDITTDFRGTTTPGMTYFVGLQENGKPQRNSITRESYQDQLLILSKTAFNIYNAYLNSTENVRKAAKEVQIYINDRFPKNP
jgi:hypothetical protein